MTRQSPQYPRNLIRILTLALTLTLALLAGPVAATGFLPSVKGLPGWEARVITTEGLVLDGVVTGSMMNWRGVRRITFKDIEGTKHKLEAKDIRQIIVPLDRPMARESLLFEATGTLVKAAKTDYRQIRDTAEMVFDTVAYPSADKRVLLPLVNPAFSSRIRVYGLLNEREWTHSIGGVKIWGDEPEAYVVVKDGGKAFKVEDNDYEEEFERLFGDCPEVMKQYDDPDFDDMAQHVLAYESLCPARRLN